ncbi:MAG: HDOD domain-containing protein [Gammaproteobacteria bacterium]|nr:MAG: HDOD domain-containing protein [Gammaproteobacteria bacterium]
MLDDETLIKVGQSFYIPPRPEVLVRIQEIAGQPEPDVNALVHAVTSDVALSAAVLKTLNSPAFGFRMRIDNIHQATMLLGIRKITALATGFLLRQAFKGKSTSISLEEFWK